MAGRGVLALSPRLAGFAGTGGLGVLALVLDVAGVSPSLIVLLSAAAIGGLAWIVGLATEQLGAATGPKISGVLNVAFGNAAEIVITIFALRQGLSTLVKASITGSILSNMLLVLGLSMLTGGLRHGMQRFSQTVAGLNAAMLTLAVIGLIVPAVFAQTLPVGDPNAVEHLSIGIGVVLMVTYLLSLVFFFQTPEAGGETSAKAEAPDWGIGRSIVVLAIAAVGLTVLSEVLVGALEPSLESWGITEAFAGLILVPLIGNASESLVAVQLALRNDMEFSMVVSLGASLQVALFVAPLLIFISELFSKPLDLVFTPLEIITVALSAVIVNIIANDGRSHWFEGAQLLAVYAIVALAFWFYP
ncbi:MAG TPA: calcium/proton exchanger [Dehalococcoidia bacterium]|nr:calcium/proton exchanger [Dehalococcoidia bacterium]